jgi:hypothetical protein
MKHFETIIIIGLLIVGMQYGCNSDQLDEPKPAEDCVNYDATYDGEIKAIVDINCAHSGCHVVGGDAPGDFKTYNGMSSYMNDGGIRESVIVLRNDPENGMPPNWDTNDGPRDLTEEEFKIMQCWINAGYPEN